MVDHGDDFFGGWPAQSHHPAAVQRTDEEWAQIARYLRHAANKIGPPLPVCLPGEPRECGRSAQQHALAWAAEIKAVAHHIIEQSAPTPEHAAFAAGTLYQRHLTDLREQDTVLPARR
ncbi:hypothetical protein [Streptomyces syringium]|uniref:hypothetical protein n=1 Tax=Streptomyces syringium TaxID=76729 RepID=UPI003412731E